MVDPLNGAGSPDREEVLALLLLDQAQGVGLIGLRALVRRFGSAADALSQPTAACRRVCRRYVPPDREARRAAEASLAVADRLGVHVVTWTDRRYPRPLLNLHDPPPLLFLRGRAELLGCAAITVVGSRRATARSRDVAERLGRGLASAGICVVSGMALGIDGAAHRGALQAEGDTVAVLGRGVDRAYPGAHRRLFRDIAERGLVVSEFSPGTPPLTHHFPRRNRILAALSKAVVVVEAGAKSGALITVDHALDLGLDVWAVPGPIDLPACAGSNRLLSEGARPLLGVAEFVDEVGGVDRARASSGSGGASGPGGELLALLAGRPQSVDELAERVGRPVSDVLELLTELELRGSVRRLPGMRFGVAA